jgi:hypothetical protein
MHLGERSFPLDTFWFIFIFSFVPILIWAYTSQLQQRRKSSYRSSSNSSSSTDSHLKTTNVQKYTTLHQNQSPSIYRKNVVPRLNQQMRLARVHDESIGTLISVPTDLLNVLRRRAIALYQAEQELSWQQAAWDILELENSGREQPLLTVLPQQVADPLVTSLLLQAGCYEDAVAYFCLSTGSSRGEAVTAVGYIQTLNEQGETFLFEEQGQAVDPIALQFLLKAGYKLLAIRYYRTRTGVGLSAAKQAIEEFTK